MTTILRAVFERVARGWASALVAAAAVCLPAVALATSAEGQPPPRVTLVAPKAKSGTTQIDGGSPQDPEVWPSTLKYFGLTTPPTLCTATIVGERAVITAAHCLKPGVVAELALSDEKRIEMKCAQNPDYSAAGLTSDLALCLPDEPIKPEPVFQFENVNLQLDDVKLNAKLFLLGYGCRNVLDINDEATTGDLYGGQADVLGLPTEDGGHVITRDGVVICPGDSGGAAYLIAGDGSAGNTRAVVGVNSGYLASGRVSAIAAFTPPMASFVRKWATENGVAICGVHAEARNCSSPLLP